MASLHYVHAVKWMNKDAQMAVFSRFGFLALGSAAWLMPRWSQIDWFLWGIGAVDVDGYWHFWRIYAGLLVEIVARSSVERLVHFVN